MVKTSLAQKEVSPEIIGDGKGRSITGTKLEMAEQIPSETITPLKCVNYICFQKHCIVSVIDSDRSIYPNIDLLWTPDFMNISSHLKT